MSAQPLTAVKASIALARAVSGCALIALSIWAIRAERQQRSAARLSQARAALAESALAQHRARRSEAVSRGNRTRADHRRAMIQTTTEQVRLANLARNKPQTEFAFAPIPTGDAK